MRKWSAAIALMVVLGLSVLLPVHAQNPINLFFGTTPATTNTGNADGGTLRVAVASNNPSLAVSATQNTSPWVVNITQIAGTAWAALTGASVGSEAGAPVRPIYTQRTASANLSVACSSANIDSCGANSTVELVLDSYNGASAFIANNGFAATLTLDWTVNGTNWQPSTMFITGTAGTATVPASGKDLQVVLATGTTSTLMLPTLPVGVKKARVRLQVLTTTGTTLTPTLAANTNGDPFGLGALGNQSANRSAAAAVPTLISGSDATTNCTITGIPVPCTQSIQNTLKGTQGSFGLATQDLKDSGRQSVMVTLSVASTQTAELLVTITKSVGLAATTTCSSCTITSGKKFRIQSMSISARNSTGTVTGNVTVKLRAAVGGATSTASPLQMSMTVNVPASASSVTFPDVTIPDGFEIDSNAGTNTWGLTITDPHWVTAAQVTTFDLTLIGYEY